MLHPPSPPGCRMLWYVTLCCRFYNSHFYQLLFPVQSHGFISNTAALFPLRLWRSTMSAKHSRICAIRSPSNVQCATHCARIDFLWRPSWQIPPPGSRVPRDPLRKLSRNFKGSRLSAQLLLVGWMVLIQKITTKTLRIQFGITMLLSSVTFSRMQEKTAGKADKGEPGFHGVTQWQRESPARKMSFHRHFVHCWPAGLVLCK